MIKFVLLIVGILVLAYLGIKYLINKGIEKVGEKDNRTYYRSNQRQNDEGFGDDDDV